MPPETSSHISSPFNAASVTASTVEILSVTRNRPFMLLWTIDLLLRAFSLLSVGDGTWGVAPLALAQLLAYQ